MAAAAVPLFCQYLCFRSFIVGLFKHEDDDEKKIKQPPSMNLS